MSVYPYCVSVYPAYLWIRTTRCTECAKTRPISSVLQPVASCVCPTNEASSSRGWLENACWSKNANQPGKLVHAVRLARLLRRPQMRHAWFIIARILSMILRIDRIVAVPHECREFAYRCVHSPGLGLRQPLIGVPFQDGPDRAENFPALLIFVVDACRPIESPSPTECIHISGILEHPAACVAPVVINAIFL